MKSSMVLRRALQALDALTGPDWTLPDLPTADLEPLPALPDWRLIEIDLAPPTSPPVLEEPRP